MKKNDLILIMIIVILALSIIGITKLLSHEGSTVIVAVDNTVLYTLPLDTDTSVRIPLENDEYNDVVIKDGTAYVSAASCPDKICVNHPAIRYAGEIIVCLPHKLTVKIQDE